MDAAGRLIADCLICGIAGSSFARSQMLRTVLEQEGGRPESRVVGTHLLLPASRAAMTNAEAMNLLDADDTFFNSAHFGSLIVSVALAEADRLQLDWTALRRAVILGFELNARLTLASTVQPEFLAPGMMIPGAALAAAALGSTGGEVVDAALGLAMRVAPGPIMRGISLAEINSLKYAPYATLAQESMFAARLASAGYRSTSALMTAEYGFLAGQRAATIRWDRLMAAPGTWWIEKTSLKPYPSFRLGQPAIDGAYRLMRARALRPCEIQSIEVQMDPRALRLPFHHWPYPESGDGHLLPISASMNLRLSVTLAALGVAPGPSWFDTAQLSARETRDLYERVHLQGVPALSGEDIERQRDPVTGLIAMTCGRVSVNARGITDTLFLEHCDGDPWAQSTAPDWRWLARKARHFLASDSLVIALSQLHGDDPVSKIPMSSDSLCA